jgi:hypothetical protein
VKKLRWLLFVPAGLFEIILAVFAGVLVTIHYVAGKVLYIAYMLPSMDWYCGGEYKRNAKPSIFEMKI